MRVFAACDRFSPHSGRDFARGRSRRGRLPHRDSAARPTFWRCRLRLTGSSASREPLARLRRRPGKSSRRRARSARSCNRRRPQRGRALEPLDASVLALFGPSGTGKTHLAHGLVRHWQDAPRPRRRRLHSPPPTFAIASIDAIKRQAELEFRRARPQPSSCSPSTICTICPPTITSGRNCATRSTTIEERGGTVIVTSHRTDRRASKPSTRHPQPPRSRPRAATRPARQRRPHANHSPRFRRRSAGRSPTTPPIASPRPVTARQTTVFGAVFELCSGANSRRQRRRAAPTNCLPPAPPAGPHCEKSSPSSPAIQGVPQKQLKSSSRRQSIVFARAIVIYLARELACGQLRPNRPRPRRPRSHDDHAQLPENRSPTRHATRKPSEALDRPPPHFAQPLNAVVENLFDDCRHSIIS